MENDVFEMIRQSIIAEAEEEAKREAEAEARREAEKITIRMSPGMAQNLYNALVFVRVNPRHSPNWDMTRAIRDLEVLIEDEMGFDVHKVAKWQRERAASGSHRY